VKISIPLTALVNTTSMELRVMRPFLRHSGYTCLITSDCGRKGRLKYRN